MRFYKKIYYLVKLYLLKYYNFERERLNLRRDLLLDSYYLEKEIQLLQKSLLPKFLR